jgi:hypothetical protein
MQRQTCGQRVVRAPLSHCQTTRYCDVDCDAEAASATAEEPRSAAAPNMVCGSDGEFHSSECEMRKKNCGYAIYIITQMKLDLEELCWP